MQLEGPFFSTSNDGFDKKLSMKQIGWQYDVEYVDGRKVEKQLISTYIMLPKAIRMEYEEAGGIGLLSDFAKKLDTEKVTMR